MERIVLGKTELTPTCMVDFRSSSAIAYLAYLLVSRKLPQIGVPRSRLPKSF